MTIGHSPFTLKLKAPRQVESSGALYSDAVGLLLIVAGTLLTFIFTSLAFYALVLALDKARGIGAALILWFYFALIYDGLVLTILFAFSNYPLEQLTLALPSLNPIDLGRIFLMLKLDVSALMGYNGATYKDFFGSSLGTAYILGVMLVWAAPPSCWRSKFLIKRPVGFFFNYCKNPGK